MEEITLFVSIVIIVFGILQIILFFKVWGMTNNVSKIETALSNTENKEDKFDWKRDFCVLITSGKKEEAKVLLLRNMINSLSFRNVIISNNESFRNKELDNLNKKYSVYLKSVGLNISDIDFNNPIYKEVIK